MQSQNSTSYFLGSIQAQDSTYIYRNKLFRNRCKLVIRNIDSACKKETYQLKYCISDTNKGMKIDITNRTETILHAILSEVYGDIEEVIAFSIEYIESIARTLGYSLVLIESENNYNYIYESICSVKSVKKITLSDTLQTRFTMTDNPHATLYYINIHANNYLEGILEKIGVMNELIAFESEKDSSVIFSLNTDTCNNEPDIWRYSYYVNGAEGAFYISFKNQVLFENNELYYKAAINSYKDVEKSFVDMLSKIKKDTELLSMIKPPRKHFAHFFEEVFINKFPASSTLKKNEMIDDVFEQLIEQNNPKETERVFATYNKQKESIEKDLSIEKPFPLYREVAETENVQVFELLSTYFVANFNNFEVEKYESFELAYEIYRKIVLTKYRKEYLDKVEAFECKVKEFK
ncbi:hypothetical protein P4605_10280 [Priestia aryabhattai]|uniref:hypothetical protein n=1 Tax=Priestia aryabhattai TaxID=412384 RepID=UPI002E1ED211|nr:hypothetical protein [Priestia aryabhattai]